MSDSLLIAAFALQHNPWRARMHYAAGGSVAAGVAIPFATIDYDPASMCTTGRITVPVDGYYQVSGYAQNSTTSVAWRVDIYRNGIVDTYGTTIPTAGVSIISSATCIIKCVAGDYLNLMSAITTTVVGNVNSFEVSWIAPA